MIWLLVALVVVGLPLVVLRFGADSRDGRDWKPLCGFESDGIEPLQRGATEASDVLLHTGGRANQA